MKDKKKLLMYAAALGTCFFWGSSFPVVRAITQENIYSPTSIMLFRYLIASIALIIVSISKGARLPDKKDLPIIFLSGFLGIFVYTWLFNIASITVKSGVSSFIISSTPIFTLILSVIFLKEKPSKQSIVGLFISFIGLFLISMTELISSNFSIDVLFLICCAILNSAYNILQRKLLTKYSALDAVTYAVVAGTVFMLIFTPTFITEAKQSTFEVNMYIIYLGLFPAAAAHYLWNTALSLADDTASVTSFQYSIPFISMILAYLWQGETISLLSLVGGLIIIFGMYVANRTIGKKNVNSASSEPQIE